MSRIGRKKIKIPENVQIQIDKNSIKVNGPKGELSLTIDKEYKFVQDSGYIGIEIKGKNTIDMFPKWGLFTSLLNNIIIGITEGFEKKLEIIGVGYKWTIKENELIISAGFSHPVKYDMPKEIGMKLDKEKKSILILSSIDKQLLGKVASEIRSIRKPEPYKGKGIKYLDEIIRRKSGKTGSADSEGKGK